MLSMQKKFMLHEEMTRYDLDQCAQAWLPSPNNFIAWSSVCGRISEYEADLPEEVHREISAECKKSIVALLRAGLDLEPPGPDYVRELNKFLSEAALTFSEDHQLDEMKAEAAASTRQRTAQASETEIVEKLRWLGDDGGPRMTTVAMVETECAFFKDKVPMQLLSEEATAQSTSDAYTMSIFLKHVVASHVRLCLQGHGVA